MWSTGNLEVACKDGNTRIEVICKQSEFLTLSKTEVIAESLFNQHAKALKRHD